MGNLGGKLLKPVTNAVSRFLGAIIGVDTGFI